jgi:hypothetical protein
MKTITLSGDFLLNEIYYNCTECSSNIEILSINEKEGKIEFECINNNHHRKMSIKEYIDKMKDFNNADINNDKCKIHKEIYICYCFDCKIHLCKECLQSRNHISHRKINILEIQPNKKELKMFEKCISYYGDKLEKMEKEKLIKTKELNDKLTEYKKIKNKGKQKENEKGNKNKEK